MKDNDAKLIFKLSKIPGSVPHTLDLDHAEIAINVYDRDIYTKLVELGVVKLNTVDRISIENPDIPFANLEEALIRVKECCQKILPPEPLFPFTGGKNISYRPSLVGSEFNSLFPYERSVRRFQIDHENGDFSDPIFETALNSDSAIVTYDLPSAILKWRMRDEDAVGNTSEWSCAPRFATLLSEVENPELDVEGKPDRVPAAPFMSTTLFNVSKGTDYHKSTDWQVIGPDGVVVWESLDDEHNLISIQVSDGILKEDTEYTLRVRHKGLKTGATDWTYVTARTAESFVEVPEIITPVNGLEDYSGRLITKDPLLNPDTAVWEISKSPTFETVEYTETKSLEKTMWQPDYDLKDVNGSTVYARVKYTKGLKHSIWSNVVSFSIPLVKIKTPVVTAGDNIMEVSPDPLVFGDRFTVIGGEDIHDKTTYRVVLDGQVIWEETSSSSLTSVRIPFGTLQPNTEYSLEIKYHGVDFDSEFGSTLIKTQLSFSKIDFDDVTVKNSTVFIEGLIDVGITEVEWEASDYKDFSSPFDTYAGESNISSWTPTFDDVEKAGTWIYIRARHKIDGFFTEWLDAKYFVPVIKVEPPTITVEGQPLDIIETPVVTTSAMVLSNPRAVPVHVGTEWRILNADGDVIWNEFNIDDLLNREVGIGVLFPSFEYSFEARHTCETYGTSDWGSIVLSTASTFAETPVETLVIDRGTLTANVSFDQPMTSFSQVEWEASDTPEFLSAFRTYSGIDNFASWDKQIIDAGYTSGDTIYVRVRYLKESFWSNYSYTSVTLPELVAPEISGSLHGAAYTSEITLSEEGFTVSHISTDWELLDLDGNLLFSKYGAAGSELEVIDFSAYHDLVIGDFYKIRARHNSDIYGTSDWRELTLESKLTPLEGYPVLDFTPRDVHVDDDFIYIGGVNTLNNSRLMIIDKISKESVPYEGSLSGRSYGDDIQGGSTRLSFYGGGSQRSDAIFDKATMTVSPGYYYYSHRDWNHYSYRWNRRPYVGDSFAVTQRWAASRSGGSRGGYSWTKVTDTSRDPEVQVYYVTNVNDSRSFTEDSNYLYMVETNIGRIVRFDRNNEYAQDEFTFDVSGSFCGIFNDENFIYIGVGRAGECLVVLEKETMTQVQGIPNVTNLRKLKVSDDYICAVTDDAPEGYTVFGKNSLAPIIGLPSIAGKIHGIFERDGLVYITANKAPYLTVFPAEA